MLQIPRYIHEAEERKKEMLGKNRCTFYGCFIKGHLTTKEKKCQYHDVKNKEELNERINAYLKNIYPEQYGECYKYPSNIADPRNGLHGLQNPIHRGVTDSTFAFYECFFQEKVIFPAGVFFPQLFVVSILYSGIMNTCTQSVRKINR